MPTATRPKPWTPAQVRRMRSLAVRGKSTAQAAKALRRSPGAVRFKAMNEGISFRSINRAPKRRAA